MVQDWLSASEPEGGEAATAAVASLARNSSLISSSVDGSSAGGISEGQLAEGLAHMKRCPSKLTLALRKVMAAHPQNAWVHADRIFSHLKEVLDPSTPQQVQELFNRVWFRSGH